VAISCARLDVDGHIVLPTNTPRQKRDRIRELGGDRVTVTMVGRTYDDAAAAALALAAEQGSTYVHPFDDPRTIAGQGTVAFGMTRDTERPLDVVVVPVGGGGLLAGVATWLKHAWPDTRVIGVEPEGAASMRAALDAGGPVALSGIDTFVDGASVGQVGALTFPVVRDLVDDVVTVSTGAISSEMLALYQSDGIIAEPAGAMASAVLGSLDLAPGARVGCIVSGGNNDVSRYADILERSLVHEGLRHYFLVSFPQEPGALRGFLDHVLVEGEDIVVFEYVKKSNRETGPALIGIDLESADGLPGLVERMLASNLGIEKIESGSPLFGFVT
jgi:threonine dehydratase